MDYGMRLLQVGHVACGDDLESAAPQARGIAINLSTKKAGEHGDKAASGSLSAPRRTRAIRLRSEIWLHPVPRCRVS